MPRMKHDSDDLAGRDVPDPRRRGLLRTLALAPATAIPGVASPERAEALSAPMERRAPRYRETEHVLTFYRTNAR